MTAIRQPWHLRIAAAIVGLAGLALVWMVVACQHIAATVQRWETQRDKEAR
ncbi:MAG: hypothetical protein L0G99_09155 [Propionibacteriales bacterium]|nr:hypothetical protein [Propionibacteriales bacterium]